MRVLRQRLEAVLIALGLARLAEADLVRRDHAIAAIGERVDRPLPSRGAEVLAVQQDDRPAVRRPHRGDVHIAHGQGLALRREGEVVDRPRVVEALKLGPERGLLRPRRARDQTQRRGEPQSKGSAINHLVLSPCPLPAV